MGLIDDWVGSKRLKDPIPGKAHIVSITSPPDSATSFNVQMVLTVQAEGIPAYTTEYDCIVSAKKYPSPGTVLPVTVDRSNPEHLRIEWDEVETTRDSAKRRAEQMAQAMNQGGTGAAAAPEGMQVMGSSQIINVPPGSDPAAFVASMLPGAQGEQAAEAIRQAMQWKQQAAGGSGTTFPGIPGAGGVGPMQVAGAGAPAAEPDPVAQIEKLARLREAGVLTTEEFDSAKRKLLGEI